jgi:hypothetical protein
MTRRLRRVVVAATAVLVASLAPVLADTPAHAQPAPPPATCNSGSTCVIELENMITWGGDNYSPGANNTVVDITPPPCLWEPEGNAYTGSQWVIDQWPTPPTPSDTLFDIYASYQQAKKLLATSPMPAGEWYWLPINPSDNQAEEDACLKLPAYFFATPGNPPPGVDLPPVTLAQLALAKMEIPTTGKMNLSPVNGVTYSNFPTFVRVALRGRYETTAGGLPYLMVTASLGANGATAWAEGSPLTLTANGDVADQNCGALGSNMMANDPAAVARTGANGYVDCGVTFREPQKATITATMAWHTCWVARAEPNGTPPPAGCGTSVPPVPGGNLNSLVWNRGVTVEEIQAGNG